MYKASWPVSHGLQIQDNYIYSAGSTPFAIIKFLGIKFYSNPLTTETSGIFLNKEATPL